MKTIEIGEHNVVFYNDIDEMPVVRYNKFQKFMMMAGGIGTDMEAFGRKVSEIRSFIENDEKKKASVELKNLFLIVDFMQRGIDPTTLAFAACVRSIDGKEYDDMSDDGLEVVRSEMAKWMTVKTRDALNDEVKKKQKMKLQRTSRS